VKVLQFLSSALDPYSWPRFSHFVQYSPAFWAAYSRSGCGAQETRPWVGGMWQKRVLRDLGEKTGPQDLTLWQQKKFAKEITVPVKRAKCRKFWIHSKTAGNKKSPFILA